MTIELGMITIDCADPPALARFCSVFLLLAPVQASVGEASFADPAVSSRAS